jgi:hypothetical protein
MVFTPPVLRLNTGGAIGNGTGGSLGYGRSNVNRSALYISGNFTDVLVFQYSVMLGDRSGSGGLDYVDTRQPPYSYGTLKQTALVSFALNMDVTTGSYGRGPVMGDRRDDLILEASDIGGVFRATLSGLRVAAESFLPLPGTVGSLSLSAGSSRLIIDPSIPSITAVRTPIPTGTYGRGFNIPIMVFYSVPVVVGGCPYLVFRLTDGHERYALYTGGSGTNILNFLFITQDGDVMTDFDYHNTHSLILSSCEGTAEEYLTLPFIRRASQHPIIDANITLPFVLYKETVIAPTSITGNGTFITLDAPAVSSGDSGVGFLQSSVALGVVSVFTTQTNERKYEVGDVIDIFVRFSDPIKVVISSGSGIGAGTGLFLKVYKYYFQSSLSP